MANCGRCKQHIIYTTDLKGRNTTMVIVDGCMCNSLHKKAQNYHYPCHLGIGASKSPNHNCPYFEPLQDGEPSQTIHAV
jgi:hypothetical protein